MTMSIIEIRKARRQGARLLIGIAGVSGSGKTYTALQLAYGLAGNDASKVGFLDTENRRGSLYADSLPGQFLIGDLYAPFSPQRYSEAIKAFQEAGVEVLIIDSVTHEWEGPGGCEEIANATRFADWKRAKALHKQFMNTMLTADMHIICCIRAREKVDFSDPKNPRPLGLQPIQEKNFMFECTASLMMHDQGRRQEVLKCPDELVPILGRQEGYLSPGDGAALRAWVDGGEAVDATLERARNLCIAAAQNGIEALKSAWAALDAPTRGKLGKTFLDTCKAAAESVNVAGTAQTSEAPDAVKALNSQMSSENHF